MELQLDNGEYQVVFRDSNLNVALEESAPLNVVVGESARIEVGEAINYIQAGTQEIAEAVQEGIASFDSNAQEKTSEFNANYTEKKAIIDAQVDIAEEQANIATSQAQTATVQASSATASANRASVSETNAKTSELSAYNSEQSASQSATTATTQAGIATTKAGEASISASNALASETSASNSALSASNSANLAKQWAIGDPSEPTGNSAKYWAEQSAGALSGLTTRVSTIEGKIPSAASSSNQLADKGYVDTADNGLQITINSKQDTLVSGTNIKTINNNSILGSGNLDINGLPTQTGQSGKFLTTDGTDASWADVDALPSQTGQSGKYLTTDGSSASWATLSVNPDNKSITTNSSDELQTVGVINSRDSSTAVKTWTGTKAQYEAILSKDANTLYNITDDTDVSLTILEALYPVGSVYITTANTCPLSTLISGSTWELVSSGRVLQGADSGHSAGTTIEAGLPNITGSVRRGNSTTGIYVSANGAFSVSDVGSTYIASGSSSQNDVYKTFSIDASASNPIYGNSTTVQPPAYVVNIFRRTA